MFKPRSANYKRLDFEFRATVVQPTHNGVYIAMGMAAFQHHLPGVTDKMAGVIGNSYRFGWLDVKHNVVL